MIALLADLAWAFVVVTFWIVVATVIAIGVLAVYFEVTS